MLATYFFYGKILTMKLNINKINKEIIRLGLNRKTLAEKMGMKSQWIYFVLSNNHSHTFKTVEKFAEVLNLDPRDLIS